jgi:4,5-DOPA dioxygenase extradiol
MANTMPAVFFGHGTPMNALARNQYTEGWAAIGRAIPRPRAIVSVSAHWYRPGVAVTAMPKPPTIHDFGGFPRELHEFQYPAPGDPALARQVQKLLAPLPVELDQRWGLDHGTWSVLCHVYPEANVPVIELAMDETQPPEFHFEVGKKLAPLRDEGILVMAAGNLVHNLRVWTRGRPSMEPFDWTVRFERKARDLMLAGDVGPLIHYETLGQDALLSIPTPDHYLPLLYILGLRKNGEEITFPVEGFDGGSVSMLCVRIG